MTRARPDGGASREDQRDSRHLDELIDEAGRESFPASDPMAISSPRRPAGTAGEPQGEGAGTDDDDAADPAQPSAPGDK